MQFDRVNVLRASVRIPSHWVDEHEEDHSVFFDPQRKGSLRVSVITKRGEASPDRVRQTVSNAAERHEGTIYRIEESYAAAWHEAARHDTGTYMFYWYVGAMVDSGLMRFAMFSYAVPTERLQEPEFESELEMVQSCALTVEFPPDTPSPQ